MKTKTPYCAFLLLLLLLTRDRVESQTLVGVSGSTLRNSSLTIEYAIGEISILTMEGNASAFTQGLLQPVIAFKDCHSLYFIPDAFTPNRDDRNDLFGVKNWPQTTAFELCIYNRWGERVFKTTRLSEQWNGEFKGQPQPVGTYVYTIKANTVSCGIVTKKGTITLLR